MKSKYTKNVVASLAFASLMGTTALSQAAVIWQDNFNQYDNGALAHQQSDGSNAAPAAPGGTGFPGQWFAVGGQGTVNIDNGVVVGNGDIRRGLGATLSSVGSVLWVSFDWGQVSSADGSYGGLTFFEDGGPERALIGNPWQSTSTWSITGPQSTALNTVGFNTGVARISMFTGAVDTIELWVGPTGSAVDVSGAAMATQTGLELSNVNLIRIMGNNDQRFDNLTIGTTMASVGAIPEPSAALLGGLGVLALLRRRRR